MNNHKDPHRLWCHLARLQALCSEQYPSPWVCLRRNGHSLRPVSACLKACSKLGLASDEQCVTSKDGSIAAILEEIAYAVLSVAWRMQGGHLDVLANSEGLFMRRGLVDMGTVFATNDGHVILCTLSRSAKHCPVEEDPAYNIRVATSMISVT